MVDQAIRFLGQRWVLNGALFGVLLTHLAFGSLVGAVVGGAVGLMILPTEMRDDA